jgi:hypothetical protein
MKQFVDVPITPGEVHAYSFQYDRSNPDQQLVVAGGFTGGGQRKDVDALLSYVAPAERQTRLPAGVRTFVLRIMYGRGIDPGSFTAELNGVDVRSLFHPAAETQESVSLALQPGRNVLKLSVRGTAGKHLATDADQLVFLTQ